MACTPVFKGVLKNKVTVGFEGCVPSRTPETYELPFSSQVETVGFVGEKAFLVKGPECSECALKSNQSLYLVHLSSEQPPIRLIAPGKVTDPLKLQTVFQSKLFYGKCFSNKEPGVFVFQTDLIEKKRRKAKLVSSYLEIIPENSLFAELLTERRKPAQSSMKSYIKTGKCIELAGINRTLSEFKLDVSSLAEDEEDDDFKESSQTESAHNMQPEEDSGAPEAVLIQPTLKRSVASDAKGP